MATASLRPPLPPAESQGFQHFEGRPGLERFAGVEDAQALGERRRFVEIVGDEHDRDANGFVQFSEFGMKLAPRATIGGRERLIKEQHGGIARQRPRDGHSLLLPTGKSYV